MTPFIQQVTGLAFGGQYTFYVWAKVASGTNQVSIAIVDNAYASYLAGPTSITLTTAWSRFKITGSGVAQAVPTASYDASTSGLVRGDAVFLEFYLANEEQVNVISVDMVNQTFTAIVTKNYPAAERRPTRWQRSGVRYQGGRVAERWLRSDRGGPNVKEACSTPGLRGTDAAVQVPVGA